MRRPAILLLPVLLAACTAPFGTAPLGGGLFGAAPQSEPDPRLAACRAEADRIVLWRERGQVMRADETESGFRTGTLTVAPGFRAESDRGRAQLERDRIVQECLRAGPDRATGAPR